MVHAALGAQVHIFKLCGIVILVLPDVAARELHSVLLLRCTRAPVAGGRASGSVVPGQAR